ncbi:MAG: hypothetical protein KAS12_03765 [Candidatus Aenigmarchaeota archaeon]|nr:hypothetical protein [Candidatus Aenigmarchaeota archaeon]
MKSQRTFAYILVHFCTDLFIISLLTLLLLLALEDWHPGFVTNWIKLAPLVIIPLLSGLSMLVIRR